MSPDLVLRGGEPGQEALDIKRNVDAGEPLSELDTIFLDQALQNLRRDSAYVQDHPLWQPL